MANTARSALLCCCVLAPASALFSNPFASLMGKQGPISTELRNFAKPSHPRLVTLRDSPPVYEIPDFLTAEECAVLVAAAEQEEFPPIPYGRKNRIFTGTKWAAAGDPLCDPFVQNARALFDVPQTRFDPVTVTRYVEGQYQAQHLDSRLSHEIQRDRAYLASGGQRIAQVICYLKAPQSGGETRFFDPAFDGLAVTPTAGTALVFPTATLEGLADERYLHSGEPVGRGDKWIVGTWLMELERTDGKQVAGAIEELWKLTGKAPPARLTSTARAPKAARSAPPKTKKKAKKR